MSKTNSLSRPSLPTGWLTPPSESNNEETYGSDYRPNNYSKPLEKPFGTANRPPPLVGALSLSGRKFRFGKNRALLNTRKYPNANTSPASNKNAEWWQTAELGTGANEPSSIGWANSYNKPLATVSNGSVAPPPATRKNPAKNDRRPHANISYHPDFSGRWPTNDERRKYRTMTFRGYPNTTITRKNMENKESRKLAHKKRTSEAVGNRWTPKSGNTRNASRRKSMSAIENAMAERNAAMARNGYLPIKSTVVIPKTTTAPIDPTLEADIDATLAAMWK